jgi:hypothetical protein
MAKPTIADARWAETVGEVASAELTTPASGDRDTGFIPGDPAAARVVNYIIRQLYLWAKWSDTIEDEDFTWTGDHEFDGGDVLVTAPGSWEFQGLVEFTGADPTFAARNEVAPTLINGWTDGTDATHKSVAYVKHPDNSVSLEGCVIPSSATNNIAFQLPAGHRPPIGAAKHLTYVGYREHIGGFMCVILVYGNGDVYVDRQNSSDPAYTAGGRFHLDGVRFRTT